MAHKIFNCTINIKSENPTAQVELIKGILNFTETMPEYEVVGYGVSEGYVVPIPNMAGVEEALEEIGERPEV